MKTLSFMFRAAPRILAVFLTACALEPASELAPPREYSYAEVRADLNFERYLSIAPASVTGEGDTQVFTFDPQSDARCFNGSPFRVTVRKGTAPNVLFYLQGGGACWDEETCFTSPTSREYAESLSAASEEAGVFSRVEANPFREWNVVYAAYCDGSLWMGDHDAQFGAKTAYFHGMANAAAALTLAKREFPAPGKLVITGSSAGGFGTLMGYVVGRTVFAGTKMYVINDSGPWRLNPDNVEMNAGIAANWRWWNATAFHSPGCPDCLVNLYRIADWAMNQDADTRWALFSFDRDVVIADLYMKFGKRFPEVLAETVELMELQNPGQFRSFTAEGFEHTALGSDSMYEISRDGQTLSEWIAAMVSDEDEWASVPRSGE